jgi:hypothetical protein
MQQIGVSTRNNSIHTKEPYNDPTDDGDNNNEMYELVANIPHRMDHRSSSGNGIASMGG